VAKKVLKAQTEEPLKRDGSVQRETFAKVEALTKKGMNKSRAFAQVAAETGKNTGTVAAAFYAHARKNGSKRVRSRRKATAQAAGPPGGRQAQNGSLDAISRDLIAAVKALTAEAKAQERELADLQAKLERIRSAV
jgi:hypothetical protein